MQPIWRLLFALSACALAYESHAQSSLPDYDRAERAGFKELQRLDKASRPDAALDHCREAFERMDPLEAPTWCWLAWREAKGLPAEDERRSRAASAAIIATGGLDNADPALFAGGEPASGRASVELARAYALSMINSTDAKIPIPLNAFQTLAAKIGSVGISAGSPAEQRLEFLRQLRPDPVQIPALWAAAAVAETNTYGVPRDNPRAYMRRLADALEPFLDAAKAQKGFDAALYPRMALVWSDIEAFTGPAGRTRAAAVRQDGLRQCESVLWPGHPLCRTLSYRAAYWARSAQIFDGHPELAQAESEDKALPRPPQIAGRRRYDVYTSKWRWDCRVLLHYDLDDAGEVANLRTAYSDPEGLCDEEARKAISALAFAPRSPDRPGEVRTDFLTGYSRSPAW
jgi:hypothetical protein